MHGRPLDLDVRQTNGIVRGARIYSNVVSPPVVSALLGFSIAWVDTPFWRGLAWAVVYGSLVSLIPISIVFYMLRVGRLSDLHISNRQERHIPYLIVLVCTVLALIVVIVFDGPELFRYLLVSNVVGTVALGFINTHWLISNHAATVALAAVFVGFVFGVTAGAALMPIVGLTFLARLLLRRHTVAQLVAGLFVGAVPVLLLAGLGYMN